MPAPYPFPIGRLARMAQVSVQALRLYERKGLLKPLKRRANGYRAYDIAALLRVETIKQLQRVGFSLAEMAEIFSDPRVLWQNPKMAQAMRRKLKEVRERIQDLQQLEAGLQDWTARKADLDAKRRTLRKRA